MQFAGMTWSVQSGSVAAAHVTRFQMSRTVLALMPYCAPTARDRALSETLPRTARACGESMEGRIEKICAQGCSQGLGRISRQIHRFSHPWPGLKLGRSCVFSWRLVRLQKMDLSCSQRRVCSTLCWNLGSGNRAQQPCLESRLSTANQCPSLADCFHTNQIVGCKFLDHKDIFGTCTGLWA
jgi:hypothetical protein